MSPAPSAVSERVASTPVPTVAELLEDHARVLDLSPDAAQAMLFQITALVPALASRVAANGRGHASDRLLDVVEASAKLGQSTQWLYRHAGALPFTVRNGRALRFSERGIDEYIRPKSLKKRA